MSPAEQNRLLALHQHFGSCEYDLEWYQGAGPCYDMLHDYLTGCSFNEAITLDYLGVRMRHNDHRPPNVNEKQYREIWWASEHFWHGVLVIGHTPYPTKLKAISALAGNFDSYVTRVIPEAPAFRHGGL